MQRGDRDRAPGEWKVELHLTGGDMQRLAVPEIMQDIAAAAFS